MQHTEITKGLGLSEFWKENGGKIAVLTFLCMAMFLVHKNMGGMGAVFLTICCSLMTILLQKIIWYSFKRNDNFGWISFVLALLVSVATTTVVGYHMISDYLNGVIPLFVAIGVIIAQAIPSIQGVNQTSVEFNTSEIKELSKQVFGFLFGWIRFSDVAFLLLLVVGSVCLKLFPQIHQYKDSFRFWFSMVCMMIIGTQFLLSQSKDIKDSRKRLVVLSYFTVIFTMLTYHV